MKKTFLKVVVAISALTLITQCNKDTTTNSSTTTSATDTTKNGLGGTNGGSVTYISRSVVGVIAGSTGDMSVIHDSASKSDMKATIFLNLMDDKEESTSSKLDSFKATSFLKDGKNIIFNCKNPNKTNDSIQITKDTLTSKMTVTKINIEGHAGAIAELSANPNADVYVGRIRQFVRYKKFRSTTDDSDVNISTTVYNLIIQDGAFTAIKKEIKDSLKTDVLENIANIHDNDKIVYGTFKLSTTGNDIYDLNVTKIINNDGKIIDASEIKEADGTPALPFKLKQVIVDNGTTKDTFLRSIIDKTIKKPIPIRVKVKNDADGTVGYGTQDVYSLLIFKKRQPKKK